MNNKPIALSNDEMKEIAAYKPIRDLWGAETAEEMFDILQQCYCVKFDFISGTPGYVGDLYIIQGDALSDAIPVSLNRDRYGHLQIVEYA